MRRQRPHGRPPVAEIVLQHGRQRHDEELAERAAGRADADRQRRLRRRRHPQDHAQHRPEGRRRQADADQDVAQDQHGAVMHGRGHDHAQHVEHAAAGDGRGRAEAVAQPPRERGDGAHQQHGQRGAEGEQLAADMELGRDRLQEDAEALADAQTDGEDEETAPNGGPVGTGGHGGQHAVGRPQWQDVRPGASIELLHAVTSCDVAQHGHDATVVSLRLGSYSCWFWQEVLSPRRGSSASAAPSSRRAATGSNASR